VTVALRGTRWRHRLSLQTPQHNETIDVFYIKIKIISYFWLQTAIRMNSGLPGYDTMQTGK